MDYQLPLSFPVYSGNERFYMDQVLDSGHLATSGGFIDKFETKLAHKMGTHQAVALNSGTSSLHLAMVMLGVGPGDEVICQSFTFCASANPIIYLGAKPIFVDSEDKTWNICPEILEDAILSRISSGKKPKLIVIVHLFGMPAKMKELMEVADKYQIPVLEDAAEAVGSCFEGKACGTFGQFGVYSFNGNKIMTTGGGGAIISNDTELIQKAKHLSTQARENLPYYQHLEIGYNYKMNNMAAAIGVAQLEQLDEWVFKRKNVNNRYRQLLKDVPGITFQTECDGAESNYWLTTILIDDTITGFSNDELRIAMIKQGVETRFLWKPLHLQPVFNEVPYYGGSTAENLFKRGLCLPSSANLQLEDQEKVVGCILKELANSF